MPDSNALNRRIKIAGASLVAVAIGAAALIQLDPPLGPIMGTIAPQAYVESLTDGQIPQSGRFVLVDAASARLFMIQDGDVEDTMRVIVGKADTATPAFSSVLRTATLNPYWNVPPELARKIIAPRVLKDGFVYLSDRGYEVITGLGDQTRVLPPDTVDWQGVADGTATVRVRQRPGPYNSMGEIKFNLARADGIYLHDTPHKELFDKPERNLSNGCVRLQDARRLARWLLGTEPRPPSAAPEQQVQLAAAVPITIAYLEPREQMKLAGLQ